MRHLGNLGAIVAVLLTSTFATASGKVDDGLIRLHPNPQTAEPRAQSERVVIEEPRKGFDYEGFETRLQSLWFQRKTFLASGRSDDANDQLERIRSFASEEGVRRVEHLAGALLAEARRSSEEGSYEKALSSLHYARAFDPDDPSIPLLRATVYWRADRGIHAAGRELLSAVKSSTVRALKQLSLFHRLAFVAGLALFGAVLVFSILMLLRFQVQFRHEVEEWFGLYSEGHWTKVLGWVAIALPLLTWFGAGWVAIYWLVLMFRFMARSERLTTIALLLALAVAVPAYSFTVALYGTTADPAVRTTVASAGGEYSPDRIVKLRQLVEAHPDDPVYRFLLAGLYKNGRYFEEAFHEYKEALDVAPTLTAAHVNVGNIFYATGQHAEAIANYRRAIEIDDRSFLAYFNMHLAQSEEFRFSGAEDSLRAARRLDSKRVAKLLSGASGWGDRPAVQDATLNLTSVWEAALEGMHPVIRVRTNETSATRRLGQLLNPISVASLFGILLCGLSGLLARGGLRARRCIRCGRPFCNRCKSGREAREYCTQCLHLFVLGDGLAPGTKSRKLYDVERHEKLERRARSFASLLLPGAAQVLRGSTGWGFLLIVMWLAAWISSQPGLLVPIGRFVGADLQPDLLIGSSGGLVNTNPVGLLALATLPVIWVLGNLWHWKRKEV